MFATMRGALRIPKTTATDQSGMRCFAEWPVRPHQATPKPNSPGQERRPLPTAGARRGTPSEDIRKKTVSPRTRSTEHTA